MGRQHRAPYLVGTGASPQRLLPATGTFDEEWLQKFVYENPLCIPIDEIEPAFGELLPTCLELPTPAGSIDVAFMNPSGLLTLVECKLWKNPEARREVVGQILDYAKEVCRWNYAHLEAAVRLARHDKDFSLYRLTRGHAGDLDETDFADSVSRNLRRGRFLLLLLGDGIRESANQIAEFLGEHAHLNFALALVEMAIFQLPRDHDHSFIVVPRVLAQTVEIEKAIVRVEEGRVVLLPPPTKTDEIGPRPKKISEEVFFETLDVDGGTKEAFQEFLDQAKKIGFYVEPGENSLKLKSEVHDANFAVFQTSGTLWNCDITSRTARLGHPEIGEGYLSALAALLPNGYVHKGPSQFWWTVKIRPNRYATLAEAMAQRDRWIDLMRRTLGELAKLESG